MGCFSQCERVSNEIMQIFDLKLDDFGPYRIDYTRNGRYGVVNGLLSA
jgi:hypothetical protein